MFPSVAANKWCFALVDGIASVHHCLHTSSRHAMMYLLTKVVHEPYNVCIHDDGALRNQLGEPKFGH